MNPVALGLAVASAAGALAVAAALLAPARVRVALVGVLTAVLGAAGMAAGGAALAGHIFTAHVSQLLPLAGVYLAVDALSGVFLSVGGAVVLAASVYGIGYFRHSGYNGHSGGNGRAIQVLWPVFAFSLVLVPAAASVSTLLVAWELMAVSSLLLVVSEHRRSAQVRSAGVWYAVMTHLGLVTILIGLVWLASAARTETFAGIAAAAPGISPVVRGGVFVLVLAGFGSKAGMVPLHAWLPRAHPEAPSPASALMSAAMVNLGVYGLVRVGLGLLGGGSRWWWLLVLLPSLVALRDFR